MTDRLTSAEAERDRSRERFRTSVAAARVKLNPVRLRAEGGDRARAAIAAVPARLSEVARRRPGMVAGIVSALALLLLRKPIFGALKRLTEEKDNG